MAKGDDVLALAKAALENNRDRVIQMCDVIMANEPANSSLKHSLQRVMRNTPRQLQPTEMLPVTLSGLVLPMKPSLGMEDMELPGNVLDELGHFFEEQEHLDLIHDAGLNVPHKILMAGPPGNGKTTLAGAIALKLNRPLLVLDFSTLISGYLGDTGKNIGKVFRAAAERSCVLFIDEMETILAERSQEEVKDVGEARRIVSTVLLEIDRLPDSTILVGATNHEELLDRAVVRRFDFHWALPAPDQEMIQGWLHRFAKRYPEIPILSEMPAIKEEGKSLSDIERDAKKWCRQWLVKRATRAAAA